MVDEITYSPFDKEMAYIITALYAGLTVLWFEAYDDAVNKWEEIQDTWFEKAEAQAEKYCNVTQPQQLKAIEAACAFGVPSPDCGELDRWSGIAAQTIERYRRAEQCFRDEYCLGDASECDTMWSALEATSAAAAAHQKWAAQRERQNRMEEARLRGLGGAKAATWMDASVRDQMFGTALSKTSSVIGTAQSGFQGSLRGLGWGIASIFDSGGGNAGNSGGIP